MLTGLRLKPSDIFTNDFKKNELRHTIVKGSIALIASQGLSFGLSLANTLILARLLTPDDFGIIGMVSVIVNFMGMFREAGLSTATVQKERIENDQISTLFWINVIISVILGTAILLASPLVSLFYKKPELTAVTAALSVSFILQGFTIQHSALLQRHLKFTILAINEVAAQIIMILVAVIMAAMGFHYWALVGGTLARSLTLVALTYYACQWKPGQLKRGTGVRSMLMFGGHLTGSYFVGYLSRNLDSLLIGRFIGSGPLGLYSRAFSLLMQPITQIRAPLTTLSLPVLSSLRHDPVRYQNYFRKLLDISISLSLPISVYCFLESEIIIRLCLGQQWMDAVPVFKVLSVAGFFVAISVSPGLVMQSYGYGKRYLQLNIATAIITSVSFIIGVPFGIIGIATSYAISSALIMIPLVIFGFQETPIRITLIVKAIIGPLISVTIAGVISFIVLNSIPHESFFNHLLVFLLYFIIYLVITLFRSETRETIHSILGSILLKMDKSTKE